MEPRDRAIRLLESYKDKTSYDPENNPSIYGVIGVKGTIREIQSSACHADLKYLRSPAYYIVEPHPPVPDREWYDEALGYITDPVRSPWKTLLPFVEVFEKGIILSAEAPANLAVNFLIAKRVMFYEFPTNSKLWQRLVRDGRNPYLSMLFANSVKWINRGIDDPEPFPSSFQFPGGHSFLDASVDVERFLRGDPTKLSGKLINGALYTPCNVIWNGDRYYHTDLVKRFEGIQTEGYIKLPVIQSYEHLHQLVQGEEQHFASCLHH